MSKRKTQIVVKGEVGPFAFGKYRMVSWEHGYVWIGNDDPDNMACFAVIHEEDAVRMARAILEFHGRGGTGAERGGR